MSYLKVEGHGELYRDSTTNSIVNRNTSDYNRYMSQKKTKNEAYFRKLLKLYKSNLLHPNIKLLLSDLKKEGKKRANVEDAAIIFFEKAFQNIK